MFSMAAKVLLSLIVTWKLVADAGSVVGVLQLVTSGFILLTAPDPDRLPVAPTANPTLDNTITASKHMATICILNRIFSPPK
jgi:hypothetical protein